MAGNAIISANHAKTIAKVVNKPNFFKITRSAIPKTPKPIPKINDVNNNGLNIIRDV